MKLNDAQVIGRELALRWEDSSESFVPLEILRRYCPCAGCRGEVDIMGNLHKGPEKPLTEQSFVLLRLNQVGGYALQPFWADGHSSGIFSYDYLLKVATAAETQG